MTSTKERERSDSLIKPRYSLEVLLFQHYETQVHENYIGFTMRKIKEIYQEEFGVSTWHEAFTSDRRTIDGNEPPRTTPFHLSIPYTSDDCPDELPAEELQKAFEENTLHAKIRMNYVFRVRNMVYKIGSAQQIIEVSSQDEQHNAKVDDQRAIGRGESHLARRKHSSPCAKGIQCVLWGTDQWLR